MNGVVIVDKPGGMTSHDVVARARRLLKTRAIGHAGTLDPMATGVLVLAIGEATKLVPYLSSEEKSYDAELAFGRATTTLDADGETTTQGSVPDDLAQRIEAALPRERARTEQVPPLFSAIHVDGQRAHERARRGEEVTLAPRPVRALRLELHSVDGERARVSLQVSKGYYVRSFARDLGEAVGCPSHLSMLRRTASGNFTLDDAAALDTSSMLAKLIPLPYAAARVLATAELSAAGLRDARAGRRVHPADFVQGGGARGPCAWMNEGVLVAVGTIDDEGGGRVLRGFQAA